MNYTKITDEVNQYIKEHLSEKRYKHSVEVAIMSKKIANKFSVSLERAYLAGLSHDIARELPLKIQKQEIDECLGYSKEFYLKPILYHGPVGAIFLNRIFKISDYDILEAIRYHSFGNENISVLSKIIYVADYISLDRTHIDECYRAEILKLDINEMVLKVTDSCRFYLNSKNEELLPETENMYNNILRNIREKEKRI